MKSIAGSDYDALCSRLARCTVASGPKTTKTTTTMSQVLGICSWLQSPPIVSAPNQLHVLAFDQSALMDAAKWFREICGAKPARLAYRVYVFENLVKQIVRSAVVQGADVLYAEVVGTLMDIEATVRATKGVHVIMLSSLTVLAAALLREVRGKPKRGVIGTIQPGEWTTYGQRLSDIRNLAHGIPAHIIWEAHIDAVPVMQIGKDPTAPKEGIQVYGGEGRNWAANQDQCLRLRADMQIAPRCRKMVYDTRAFVGEMIGGGRGFDRLLPREPGLYDIFQKLGLQLPSAPN